MKIDEILRTKKSNRPRKKKNNDEVLDSFADDEVARLREAMSNAAEEDIRANQEKLPATSKLKLLPEAMETLRKYVLFLFLPSIINFFISITLRNVLLTTYQLLSNQPQQSLPSSIND